MADIESKHRKLAGLKSKSPYKRRRTTLSTLTISLILVKQLR